MTPFCLSFGNHRVTASLGCGGTHPATALWTQGGVWAMDPDDSFSLPQPQAAALPGSGGGAGAGSVLVSSTPEFKPPLLQHTGSPMDVTAEKLHFLIWQGHTSVPRGHQGITWPTSHQLAPHPSPWGARPDPFNPSYVVPGTSCWIGCPQPPPTYARAPLSSALSHLCWQLGHSRDPLRFGVSHALTSLPGADQPQQRSKSCHCPA